MISVYDSKCTGLGFNNNGLVILKDCISALVPEQLNGTYELELEHPLDIEGRWKYLVEDNIIRADGQLFRIYHKVTTLTSRTINARHIFYDQIDNYVEGATITGTANDAMAYISTHKQYADEFTLSSDLVDSNKLILPSANPVELIMGTEGLITTLGGELMRDNFDSKLLINRGSNKNVLISYGKNIKGIKEDIDLDVVATRLNVVGTNSEKKIYLPEKYIDSPLINNYSHPKTRSLTLPMDIIQYTVTAAVTTAISVYKSASVINNASFAGDVADTKIIASISGKERIEASEKVSLNTIWQAIHTDYNIKYNYALPWFDEPTATYALLDDLKTAIPKGNDNIYEVTNIDTVNGQKWYYWTSFAWEETERIDKQLDNYTTAYNMLKAYLDPILATMSTPTNIHSTDMKAKFKTYYTDRSIITTAVFNKTINSLWKIRSKANYDSYIVKLRQMATDYFKTSECDIPHPNYTIDFVELSKTEEYKNYKVLQGVELGDTVIVRHVKLGIDLQLEVIKTTKNILTGNLDVVELGSLKPTLSTSFTNTDQAIQAISTRVSSLENNSAKVVDGVIINGTIDFDKINAMESLYNQLTNADSNADIYVDSITGRLATFDELVAGNITAVNIKTGSLTADTITAGTITANEMKVGTITAESGILDMASIGAAIIDNAVIGTTQIADGSITDAKIVSLTAEKIVSGTVDTSKVTILGPNGNLRIANSRLQVFDSSETPIERVSIGDVNGDQTEYGLRVRGADGTTILLDENGVRNEGITDGAIDNSKISADADINGTKLLSNSITGGKLVIDAITAREIASKTITANEILAGTITANEIAAGTITASKIKVGELVVGVNVTMGAGAIISWSNLSAESQTNLTGTDGTNGTNRTSGTNGATGATGSQGYTGSTGSTGPQGKYRFNRAYRSNWSSRFRCQCTCLYNFNRNNTDYNFKSNYHGWFNNWCISSTEIR